MLKPVSAFLIRGISYVEGVVCIEEALLVTMLVQNGFPSVLRYFGLTKGP